MGAWSKLTDPAALSWALRGRLFSAATSGREKVEPRGDLVYLGTPYGGWVVPGESIASNWIVWSAGAGSDVSFDVEQIRRFGARVRSFDPLRRHLDEALEQVDGLDGYSVHQVAIGATDGPVTLWGSGDPDYGRVSVEEERRGGRSFVAEGRTIASLAAELGDPRIDLLKLSIVGKEYEVLTTLDLRALGVQVLCVELNPTVSARVARRALGRVREQGYALVARERRDRLTFVRSG
jgi:FkbM family methyltransferase